MALYGMRPAEIQFLDFIYPGFDQIVSEAASAPREDPAPVSPLAAQLAKLKLDRK